MPLLESLQLSSRYVNITIECILAQKIMCQILLGMFTQRI